MNLVLDSPPSLCGSSQSNHLVPSTLGCSLLAHNRWLSDSIPFFLYKSESLCPRIKSVNLAHRHIPRPYPMPLYGYQSQPESPYLLAHPLHASDTASPTVFWFS